MFFQVWPEGRPDSGRPSRRQQPRARGRDDPGRLRHGHFLQRLVAVMGPAAPSGEPGPGEHPRLVHPDHASFQCGPSDRRGARKGRAIGQELIQSCSLNYISN